MFLEGPHKITSKYKSRCSPGLRKFPKIWEFSFNISAMDEASNFKFSTELALGKAHDEIKQNMKADVAISWESP